MEILLWTVIGFISGAVPYSLMIGRLVGGVDIRKVGDHNPGAANVGRATNPFWSVVALLLDGFKGAIPVALAWFWIGIDGWGIVPVALAPIIGHAFSPFLSFRGGKALSTTFGAWLGITSFVGPTILGLLMTLLYTIFASSGWAVMFSMLAFGAIISLLYWNTQPEFIVVWVGNFLLLLYKHRQELTAPPVLRPRWSKLKKQ